MVITKTPYRISFFGGGSDFPAWYLDHGGAVFSTTINKYCYISLRYLPRFFDHVHRFVYSEIESVKGIGEIKHPAIRGILSSMNWMDGIEMHHDGDLPARSGLGASSSFSVGLLNALYALRGLRRSPDQLALEAINVEQNIIRESVGSQDQIAAAFGGLNKISFLRSGGYKVDPVILPRGRSQELLDHLMLFYTGEARYSAGIEAAKIEAIEKNKVHFNKIYDSVESSIRILENEAEDICNFGALLEQMWQEKKSLSQLVTSDAIEFMHEKAIAAGSIGFKVLGAGGGGFCLVFASPENQPRIRNALSRFLEIPFAFERQGSTVTLYNPGEL